MRQQTSEDKAVKRLGICPICKLLQWKPEGMPNDEYEEMIYNHLEVHDKYGQNLWTKEWFDKKEI